MGERYVLENMKSYGDVNRTGPLSSASFASRARRASSSAVTIVAGPVRDEPGSLPPGNNKRIMVGSAIDRTYNSPLSGSTATPPQLVPPLCPGISIEPRRLGGVNSPSL